MPRFGDILKDMAVRSGLPQSEAEYARLRGNAIDAAANILPMIADGAGLRATVFEGREFTVFPSMAASLRFSAQTIATSTAYSVPSVDTASAATWTYGIVLDTANARINVPGMPGESLLLFTLWWRWDPEAASGANGRRALQWTDNSGNSVEDVRPALADQNNYCHVSHVRRMASADTWYQLKIWQNSGGNLVGDGLFTVFRMR